MGRAALYSCLLHSLIIILCWLGLPQWAPKEKELAQPIPIEIITIAEETQAPKPEPIPVPEPPKPVEKKPEPKPEPVPEKPTPPEPKTEPEPIPTPPIPSPKPEPEVKPEPAPEPVPLPSPKPPAPEPTPKPSPPKPKPPEKPKEKKEVKNSPKKDSFDSILKNLEKMEDQNQEDLDKSKKTSDKKSAQQVGKVSDRLTMSEMDKLRTHFKNCWSMPAGAQDAENLSVQIKIWANPDGTVKEAQIVDKGRAGSDPYYRIAAEAALRAARDPQCAKLPLSLDKYDLWKVMILNFDPRFLLGG